MDNLQLLAIVLAIVIVVYAVGYFSGRLLGYRQGLDQGKKSLSQVEHLKGMTDGYVMALQHTPAQRNEYMNNVLVRIGAMTPSEVEAQRQLRFQVQMGK